MSIATPDEIDIRDACREYFMTFLAHLRVERPGGAPRSFGAIADDWQWELAELLALPVEWLAQRGLPSLSGETPATKHFWIELPKKHNKTTLGAAICSYLLQNATRQLNIHVAAANRSKQAKIIRDQIAVLRRLNPELLSSVGVPEVADIRGRAGVLQLLAADEATTQGGLPHLTLCDEVTVWNQLHGENLWSTLHSNWIAHQGIFLVLSNAGYAGSWQEKRYRDALDSSNWTVYSLKGRHASWLSDEAWQIIRSEQTPTEARRVCDNEWTTTMDEPLFSRELLDRATGMDSMGEFLEEIGWQG